MKDKINFVDAQEMKKLHPDTFQAPDLILLTNGLDKNICKFCKVSAGGERFWVIVTKFENGIITGSIDNHLISSDIHGLYCGDEISFKPENVYTWME